MKNNDNSDGTKGKGFLVLVPHRDIRVVLRNYNKEAVSAGLTGVYSFPWVAPLAELAQPLTAGELKYFACSLRKVFGRDKMHVAEMSAAVFPSGAEDMTLFGPRLMIDTDFLTQKCKDTKEFETGKIKTVFSDLVIGTFLAPKTHEQQLCAANQKFDTSLRENPPLSFRAAALANMYWRPFQTGGEVGYKWKIGKLSWLPKV
jgi:hypothetical protein